MMKSPLENQLGKALRAARKERRITQVALAKEAKLSAPTIGLLEKGRGTLASWHAALAALKLEIKGQNLSKASTLGKQIALLRKRRKLSHRTLAKLAGLSPPTVMHIQKRGGGYLQALDRILTVLGAGPRLVPKGQRQRFYTHNAHSSAQHDWQTPAWLLERLYSVFGRFDLDPCSPTKHSRRAPVRARVCFTEEDDGLSLAWFGVVFLNPPYGRTLRLWTAKAKAETFSGNAKTIVAVVPARTDTTWWHEDIAQASAVFFLRGRLSFGTNEQSAPFPSALVVWGGSPEITAALKTAFPDAWQLNTPAR